jgi:hypothetical protein
MQFSNTSRFFLSFMSKYSPHYIVIRRLYAYHMRIRPVWVQYSVPSEFVYYAVSQSKSYVLLVEETY